MPQLKTTASKAQELAHLTDFISTLDEGTYLHSMFAGAADFARVAMLNDTCEEPLKRVGERRNELAYECERISANLKEITAKVDFLRAEKQRLLRIADYIKEKADDASRAASAACRELASLDNVTRNILDKAQQ